MHVYIGHTDHVIKTVQTQSNIFQWGTGKIEEGSEIPFLC